jgi:hypothetical protein
MLDELRRRHEVKEVSEAVQLRVINARAEDLQPAPLKIKYLSPLLNCRVALQVNCIAYAAGSKSEKHGRVFHFSGSERQNINIEG